MCISDYRLGEQIRSQLDAFSVAVGTPVVIPPDPNRTGIIINTSAVISVITSFVIVTVAGVCVGKLWSSAPTIAYLLKEHGDLCQREFTLTATTSTAVCGVVRLTLPQDVIAAALSEFSRSQ